MIYNNNGLTIFISVKHKTLNVLYDNAILYSIGPDKDRYKIEVREGMKRICYPFKSVKLSPKEIIAQDIIALVKIYEQWFNINIDINDYYAFFKGIDRNSTIFPYKKPKLSPGMVLGTMSY